MKSDDPKLTSYALDELEAAEREEIEQLLREHPEVADEVEATRAFAADLRRRLQSEPAEPLLAEQRAEVLACAAAEQPRNVVAFRRRVAAWIALAACVLVGIGWALLFPALDAAKRQSSIRGDRIIAANEAKQRDGSEVAVALDVDALARVEESLEKRSIVIADVDQKNGTPTLLATNPTAKAFSLSLGASQPERDLYTAAEAYAVSEPLSTAGKVDLNYTVVLTPSARGRGIDEKARGWNVQRGSIRQPGETAVPAQQATSSPGDDSGVVYLGKAIAAEPRSMNKVKSNSLSLTAAAAPKQHPAPTAGVPSKPDAAMRSTTLSTLNRGRLAEGTTARVQFMTVDGLNDSSVTGGAYRESTNPDRAVRLYETPETAGQNEQLFAKLRSAEAELKSAHATLSAPTSEERTRDFDNGMARKLSALQDEVEGLQKQLRGVAEAPGTESYDDVTDNPFIKTTGEAARSTFSIDVDTASYANVRRFLNGNSLPPKAAVRIEELVNYFHYDYPQPDGETPFSAAMEVAACPWAPEHRLLRVGLHGRDIARNARPASNLVFLIDVSGSMQPENKLPLLKRSLQLMVDQLSDRDQVGIVVYAGAAGCVLTPTHSKQKIREAIGRLESGGSTHGSAGLQLAYEMACEHFIKGGTNRVILATDGDWNVGVTDKNELWSMIEAKAKSGVFLTVLGFGMDNLKDDMLEKLADKGNGNYAYIDTLNEGRKVLVDELGATLVTIAKDVKIQIEFNPAQVGAYRLIGYENRVLAAKDFNDDTKDAGEIGAGHNVTAFYELIPAGKEVPPATPGVEPLKYQPAPVAEPKPETRNLKPETSDELLTLKLRYKAPDADTSTLREFRLKDSGHRFENSSRDFRFGAAVVGYGMLLRGSPHKGNTNWELVHELAVEGKGDDRDGYRAEFVGLVERARALMR